MRNRWLSFVFLIGATALIASFAAPVVVADDETVQAENSPDQASAPAEATAPDQASTPAPASEPVKAAKPKMVCRKEPSTGSAIPTRICRTPRQIDADREAAKGNINSMNDGQSGRSTGGGG